MRMLLVEDDRMIGNSLRQALRLEGHAVDWVYDAAAAHAALASERFDLVLLDLGLPTRAAPAGGGAGGLALRPLTQQEKRESRIEQGMVVQQVGGAAARAGITEGDVLLSINGKPAGSIEQIRELLDRKPKSVALLVERDGNRLFVPVPLG